MLPIFDYLDLYYLMADSPNLPDFHFCYFPYLLFIIRKNIEQNQKQTIKANPNKPKIRNIGWSETLAKKKKKLQKPEESLIGGEILGVKKGMSLANLRL